MGGAVRVIGFLAENWVSFIEVNFFIFLSLIEGFFIIFAKKYL